MVKAWLAVELKPAGPMLDQQSSVVAFLIVETDPVRPLQHHNFELDGRSNHQHIFLGLKRMDARRGITHV